MSPYQNEERARCPRFGGAARREEGEYPLWIFDRRATPQQRQRSATRRAVFWRAPGRVAPQSESALAIFLRRALPAARQKTACPFLILIWALPINQRRLTSAAAEVFEL